MNLLEFWHHGYKKLFITQIPLMIFVVFLLLAMRLNFFMDVITAMAFSYIVYSLIYSRKDSIDSFLLNPKQKINEWVNRNKDDISTVNND